MFATRRHPRHLCPVPRQSIIDELEETPRREESWALWIILGLLLSAALHLAFVWWARDFPVKTFSDSYYDQLVPRAFKVDRVDIDAALLEEKETPAETPRSIAPVPVELPPENIADEADSPSSVADKPAQLGLDAELLPEVHHTRPLDQLAPDTTVALEEDLQSMRDTLLADQPASPRQPALALGEIAGGPSGAGAADSDVPAGYSNLDELLARTGALAPHDAPIFMPADVLFGYDESFLRPDAITASASSANSSAATPPPASASKVTPTRSARPTTTPASASPAPSPSNNGSLAKWPSTPPASTHAGSATPARSSPPAATSRSNNSTGAWRLSFSAPAPHVKPFPRQRTT